MLTNSNGMNEIANEKGTAVSLRTPTQATKAGSAKFLKDTDKGGDVNTIGTMGNEAGHITSDSKRFNIKVPKGSKFEYRPVDFSMDRETLLEQIKDSKNYRIGKSNKGIDVLIEERDGSEFIIGDLRKGKQLRFFTVNTADSFQKDTKNIAYNVIHETAHMIQFKHDPRKGNHAIMRQLMYERDLKTSDSISMYGSTNESEFFAETYTAYLANPGLLKAKHRDLFDFIEELLYDKYGIDRESITFAK